jgi:O-antigen/teichoic acid export membrane protein
VGEQARHEERAMASGSAWITLSEVFKSVTGFIAVTLAARYVPPSEFGLMGIVFLVIAILESFSQSGFDQALIQRQDDVEGFLNVAWTWQLLRGVALAALVALLAVPLASWYEEPQLVELMLAAALSLVLFGLRNVAEILFSRELNFRKLFGINVATALIHLCVSIPAILLLANVWSLMIGHVAGALATCVISFVAHSYRPKLAWDRAKLGQLVKFGKWVTGMSILSFISTRGDDLFLSKFLGKTSLGYYQMAYNLSNLPTIKITHVISRVSFPTYAKLQHEPERLRELFIKVCQATLLLSGTLSVGIWYLVPEIVAFIIGPRWEAVIVLVKILVIAGFIRSFAGIAGALFQACGRPDLDFKMNLGRALLMIALIWPAAAWRGLEGACYVVLLGLLSCLPVWFVGVKRIVHLSIGQVLWHTRAAWLNLVLLAASFELTASVITTASIWGAVGRLLAALVVWSIVASMAAHAAGVDLVELAADLNARRRGEER